MPISWPHGGISSGFRHSQDLHLELALSLHPRAQESNMYQRPVQHKEKTQATSAALTNYNEYENEHGVHMVNNTAVIQHPKIFYF